MAGREVAGSLAGRSAIEGLVADLGLTVATTDQPHVIDGVLSIDHIALPTAWGPAASRTVAGVADGVRLSDHDAYIADVAST